MYEELNRVTNTFTGKYILHFNTFRLSSSHKHNTRLSSSLYVTKILLLSSKLSKLSSSFANKSWSLRIHTIKILLTLPAGLSIEPPLSWSNTSTTFILSYNRSYRLIHNTSLTLFALYPLYINIQYTLHTDIIYCTVLPYSHNNFFSIMFLCNYSNRVKSNTFLTLFAPNLLHIHIQYTSHTDLLYCTIPSFTHNKFSIYSDGAPLYHTSSVFQKSNNEVSSSCRNKSKILRKSKVIFYTSSNGIKHSIYTGLFFVLITIVKPSKPTISRSNTKRYIVQTRKFLGQPIEQHNKVKIVPENGLQVNIGTLSALCSNKLSVPDMSKDDTADNIEDNLLKSDSEESTSGDLNKTITTFGNLLVGSYVETTSNKKRNRSSDTTPVDSPNPIKKQRPINEMLPLMADIVKTDNGGHMVDIVSDEGKPPLTKDQCDEIQRKITTALFAKEDISNIKFETPYFDGNKLRMVCKNDETRAWLLNTIPDLKDLWENAAIKASEMGPPPKLVTASISMPAKTYDPPVLFQIIQAQNSIDTKFWRYKSRTKVANGRQTWYIGIDENSLPALKELGYRPHVGIERIKISVNNHEAK